jgi:hypothetical protein
LSALIPFLGTITAAVATAIFGILSYRNQKETDRKVELRNRRMNDYQCYLVNYREALQALEDSSNEGNTGDEAKTAREYWQTHTAEAKKAASKYWQAYSTLFQIASDPVLLAVTEFHKLAWRNDPPLTGEAYSKKFRELYATMICEMRRDAFAKTKLRKELVEERLPFEGYLGDS